MNINDKIKLSVNIAKIAGVFCIAVSALLLLNYYQVSKSDPLESETMKTLIERLASEPGNNELKEDIRNLDLLARKAYFNSQWQILSGSYMLLFGVIVFVLSLRVAFSLKAKIEHPEQIVENELLTRKLSQKWLLISGVGLLGLAFTASVFTVNHLDLYSGPGLVNVETPIVGQAIEVIEVGNDTEKTGAHIEKQVSDYSAIQEETIEKPIPVVKYPDIAQIRANSPSFRGPLGNGVFTHKNIPVDFDVSTGKNILWKTTVPLAGYNSPVVWGNRVFLSGASAQKREVYCIDANNGKILWGKSVDNIPGSPSVPPKTTEDTGLAAPSLAVNGINVFAIFGTGDVICFDMEGNRAWARNLGVPDNHYGHSSSLLTLNEKLFVQYDTNKGQGIMALNVTTGETIWETKRNVKISWASPVLANVGGKHQIILATDPIVAGYDIENGKELWTAKGLMGEVGPSPAFGEGLVFATQEYATLLAINPANGQIVWQSNDYLSEVASPVASGGIVFIATSYGILVGLDTKTGEKLWENDGGDGYYSSPVVADNKLFIFDMDGRLQVYALEREKKLLAESELKTKVVTTPAFAEGRMYVRSGTTLFCIGK